MENRRISRDQAKQFILCRQGLLGKYRFAGKEGAYQYVRQAGCIQYDPVDVCGKNAELTLQSRVKGFRKSMLQELLYEDRKLVDTVLPYKNMALISEIKASGEVLEEEYLDTRVHIKAYVPAMLYGKIM